MFRIAIFIMSLVISSPAYPEPASKVMMTERSFLENLKPGDNFWLIRAEFGKGPVGVEGPITIKKIARDNEYGMGYQVFYTGKDFFGNPEERHYYVRDIASPYMGVFLSKEDAETYLKASRTDPEVKNRIIMEKILKEHILDPVYEQLQREILR